MLTENAIGMRKVSLYGLHTQKFIPRWGCVVPDIAAMGGRVSAVERLKVQRSRPYLDAIRTTLDSWHLYQQLV